MQGLHTSRGQAAALWAAAALAALLSLPLWGAVLSRVPACRFQTWTGEPCLGCGSGTALLALRAGHWGEAFASSPLAAAGFAAFVVGGLWSGAWLLGWVPKGVPAPRSRALWLVLTLIGINWIYLVLSR